jgi:hypothetical protein
LTIAQIFRIDRQKFCKAKLAILTSSGRSNNWQSCVYAWKLVASDRIGNLHPDLMRSNWYYKVDVTLVDRLCL